MFVRLLCVMVLLAASVKAQEEPVLLVHQSIDNGLEEIYSQLLAENKEFKVQINVHNIGKGSAHDAKLSTPWPEDKYTVSAGASGTSWDVIEPDQTVSHNLTIVPKAGSASDQPVYGVRASITYKLGADGETQTGHSSPQGVFQIIDEARLDKLTAKHYPEWIVFIGGFAASVVLPWYAHKNQQEEFPGGSSKSD